MLKIENTNFLEKFTEINIRQRMYEGKSYITLIINTEFYPSLVNNNMVSGNIEVKLDLESIKSINELINKKFSGDIGKVTISVNNNGIWEHKTFDEFNVKINKRDNRILNFNLNTDNCVLETNGVIVSLYTTTNEKELKKEFDLTDFYENPTIKEIGNNKIIKFYVKE